MAAKLSSPRRNSLSIKAHTCSENSWNVPTVVWDDAPAIIKEQYVFQENILESLIFENPEIGEKETSLWILRLQNTDTKDYKVLKIMPRSIDISELDIYKMLEDYHVKSKYLLYADLLHRGIVYDYILTTYHKLTLFDLVVNEKKLTMKRSLRFMTQLTEALNIMNMCGYAHCDIKPENILFNEKDDSILLFDYGSAAKLTKYYKNARPGSPQYIPPEYYCKIPITYNYDIWSIGATFFVCLYGYPPVMSKDICHGKLCIYWPTKNVPISYGHANILISSMMRRQAEKRISLATLVIELEKQTTDDREKHLESSSELNGADISN